MSDRHAGLYVHVPFCARICPYCDFAVRTGDAPRRRRYVDHLLLEIERHEERWPRFDTIYFGGGTPSRIEPEDLGRIVAALKDRFDFVERPWILLEANPEDVTEATASAWRELDVRTLSLGIQSLDDDELRFLGRTHDGARARRAIETARAAEFDTVSIDLIYGLPDQSVDTWKRRMDSALETAPDHVSCYQLTIHEGTRFALLEKRGTLTQLPDAKQADAFRAAHEHLHAAGYGGYEVSQFARDERHRSPHNQKYWNHTPYLGLGPSAHSFDGENRRWWNLRKNDDWQDALARKDSPRESQETLSREELILETLMTGFRTYRGVDCAEIARRFGVDLRAANRERIERLESTGMIQSFDGRLIPTLDGLAVADSLATLFRFE